MGNLRKISKKRETFIAKELGGRVTPGSGNLWFQKSDVYTDSFRIEDKFTFKDNYRISYDILRKIEKEANQTKKIPLLHFGFFKTKDNYIVVKTTDCNSVFEVQKYYTNKKSILFTQSELNSLYLKSKELALLEIIFEEFDKSYYCFSWNAFKDNRELFFSF